MRIWSTALLVAALTTSSLASPTQQNPGNVLFLGNSLTAGLGVARDAAFPYLIQQRIEARGWPFRVVDAGVSGDTSAGGLRRIDWMLRQQVDVLVIELGGNDGLRGVPTETTRANLQAIINHARAAYPEIDIVLAGMLIPPNLGPEYSKGFQELYSALASANDVELIPFLLDGVAADPALNQADGIHPNAAGHRIVVDNVWQVLESVLERRLSLPESPG